MSILQVILSFSLPLLWTIGLTIVFIYGFRKKLNFQQLLPISLMSAVLLIYAITMLCHNLSIAVWLVAILAGGSIPLLVFDKQGKKVLFENILTPGLVAYILLYILLYIINFNKVIPLLSDSSMHWAPHVWVMWLRNDFYTSPGLSIVNHGDYTPALQLFEVMWMKLAGIWHEGFLYLALQIIGFSFIFPAIGKLTWNSKKTYVWPAVFLFLITALVLPLVLPVSNFYNNIEVDTVLAFIFAYGVYLAVVDSKKVSKYSLIKMAILLTFTCLIKQVALVFVGIILLVFMGNVWLNAKMRLGEILDKLIQYIKKYQKNWQGIVLALVLLLLSVLAIKLWSLQTSGYQSPDKGIAIFHLGLDEIRQIPSIMSGHAGNASQQAYPVNLAKYLISNPVGFSVNFFGAMSYVQFFIIMLAALVFVVYKYKDRLLRNRVYLTSTALFIGWGLYLFTIMATFLVGGMKDVERNNMATGDRYLRTYVFAVLVLVVMMAMARFIRGSLKSRSIVSWLTAILVLFGVFMSFSNLGLYKINTPTLQSNSSELLSYKAPRILRKLAVMPGISFARTKTVIVTEKTRDPSLHYLQYSALPNRVTVLTEVMLKDKNLCKLLASYDYLVIDYVSNETKNIDSCLANPNNSHHSGKLYKRSELK